MGNLVSFLHCFLLFSKRLGVKEAISLSRVDHVAASHQIITKSWPLDFSGCTTLTFWAFLGFAPQISPPLGSDWVRRVKLQPLRNSEMTGGAFVTLRDK